MTVIQKKRKHHLLLDTTTGTSTTEGGVTSHSAGGIHHHHHHHHDNESHAKDGTDAPLSGYYEQEFAEFGQNYHCDICRKDISNVVRIHCAVCPDFDLCIHCFCSGAELDTHKNDHPYRVMEMLNFPLYESEWTAEEELLLIEGLELYGMGNWEQVAEHINTTKTKKDCLNHYINVFVNSPTWPLPDNSENEFDRHKQRKLFDFEQVQKKPPPLKPGKPLQSHPHLHEISGFMPARGEFDAEFENEAETHVKELTFDENETKEERDIKLALLEIYNSILERRGQRKKFTFDRKLTNFKTMASLDKKLDKPTKDLITKYRVFAKMMRKEDWDELMGDLMKESSIRQRISQLQEMRRNGVTTREQEAVYWDAKKQRSDALLLLMSRERSMSMSTSSSLGFGMGATTTGATTSHTVGSGNHLLANAVSLFNMESSSSPSRGMTPGVAGTPGVGITAAKGISSSTSNKQPTSANVNAITQPLRKITTPINVSEADGVSLLTPLEQTLCSNLRILPRPYLVIKETVLREAARLGGVMKRRQARELIKIDVNKTSRIYDFFVEMGWVLPSGVRSGNSSGGGQSASSVK